MESRCTEKKIVEQQLGREVKNNFTVVKKCRWGYPQCIQSSLITEGKPFPTLFWLTCPLLSKEVSRLEEKGWIKRFEENLQNSEELFQRYLKAHRATIELKASLVKANNLKNWQKEALLGRGIGGIKNLKTVKCLHLQLANYLSGIKNPIGESVWKMLSIKECNEDNVLCKTLEGDNEKRTAGKD
ncbi:DUF501 domain-containing protein [Kosmotoga pacifica]|uniref:DUF501 domain-containing protein n=1 Tax=Kosmotoga pacifica TaxID=1330330 RepID=A0A0G2Z909_9BACT|nr:DUF501 domain-containing protein [Kosmotoga pacifica]AKI98085.1 hypothetical protein IX53_09865 [Kosmotoga pacifica]